jgi:hypothetical protein
MVFSPFQICGGTRQTEGFFPIPCRDAAPGETVDPLYSHLSALFVLYRSLGESRCNSIVDRVIENIDSNF